MKMKQNIRIQLKELYNSAPPVPEPERIQLVIDQAGQILPVIPRQTSLLQFIAAQVRFMNAKIWIAQFFLLFLYVLYVGLSLRNDEGFLLLVPIAPVVVLIGTGELSRSFRYHMAELESSTRFSLRQILVARTLIVALTDIFMLTCLLFLSAVQLSVSISALILYGIVPCLITALGCLWITNHCRDLHSQYYMTAYSIAVSLVGTLSVTQCPAWYDAPAQWVWVVAFFLTLAGVLWEFYKMLQNSLRKMECPVYADVIF